MNSDDVDTLMFSHQNILEMLDNVSNDKERDKIITEFIKTVKTAPVPDFPKDLEWFNVTEALSFSKHLKGKLVLLDFFTYCCINCMHILPDLKEIEKQFSVEDGLVVIGVHSAKFDNEKISSNIFSAVQRYNISHPVVNDPAAFMWNSCGINCWPTLMLLGPQGNPLLMLMGEGHKDDLLMYIRNCLNYYRSRNEISKHSLPLESSFRVPPDSNSLLFPGKITVYSDPDNNNLELLAISDTGKHRILVVDPTGLIIHQVGSGTCGFQDGGFTEAQFNAPQGLVFQNEHVIFVADTENHAIRRVDLQRKTVETIAGTGTQGIDRSGGKAGPQQEISSPWDVCVYKTPDMDLSFHLPNEKVVEKPVLLVAMAGTHQIWAVFLEDVVWWKFKKCSKGSCVCIAGSGKEENRNNAYPHAAGFAQPSGLALCEKSKEVYVADSESSSVRRLAIADGKVSAVVGGEKSPTDLFGFGDVDGTLHRAKLQHPLGVTPSRDNLSVYVADSYNHKIKVIDITSNSITSLQLPTQEGNNSSSAIFNEPSGLCFSGDGSKLYVCDTNNHSIKVLHFGSPNQQVVTSVTKLELRSSPAENTQKSGINKRAKPCISASGILSVSSAGGNIMLKVKCGYGDGFSLTPDAPQKWLVILPNESWSASPSSGVSVGLIESVISVPNVPEGTQSKFYVECNLVVCKEDVCLPKNFVVEFSVNHVKNGSGQIKEGLNVSVGADLLVSHL